MKHLDKSRIHKAFESKLIHGYKVRWMQLQATISQKKIVYIDFCFVQFHPIKE